MIRIALLATALSLTACTPSTEPAVDPATTTQTPPPVAPAADSGMSAMDAPMTDATNTNIPAPNPAPADERQMTPADPTLMPKRAVDRTTGISAPAPPPIEDPAPTPPPTQ